MDMKQIELTQREIANVLVALRHWLEELDRMTDEGFENLHKAHYFYGQEPLNYPEICSISTRLEDLQPEQEC